MNYTLYLDKILPIARSLAAMQILADNDGDGDGTHPLSPLLDDFRLPVMRPLMLQAYLDMVLNLRRYISDVEIPQTDEEFTTFSLAVITPIGFGSPEADMLLGAMEQIIALSTVAAVMRAWKPGEETGINAFTTLAAEYLAKARSLLAPPYPPAITPIY